MLKILIVEDDQDKLRRLSKFLSSIPGIGLADIENVVDSHSAKLKLRGTCYDLLIVDIAIPNRIDQDIKQTGGIDLLREVILRDVYKLPSYMLAVTGYEEVYKNTSDELSDLVIPFFYCDAMSDDWLKPLKNKISRIVTCKSQYSTEASSFKSLLNIVCALDTTELDSILQNGWEWNELRLDYDETTYYSTEINLRGHLHKIYAAAAPHMGMPFAGVLSMKMINLFKPEYIAMAGITAGYKKKVKIGDIIAADPVWDWGSGKWVKENGKQVFEQELYQLDMDVGVRNKLKLLSKDEAELARIKKGWQGDVPDHELSVKVGPLASGAAVLADSDICKQILTQHRGLHGIEMESYAVYAAAQEAPLPKPKAFSIKSVVDFADENKDDSFRKYAAYTSAQTLKVFVETYLIS
jgi:nucleoside phosphorylase/CheY-like chemotaxis protein